MEQLLCRKCSRPFTRLKSVGAPAKYCSVGCRRAAEYEVRRLQRALENLEASLRADRLAPGLADPTTTALTEAERDRVEQRLTFLLDDDDPAGTAPDDETEERSC
jgi:hypothetical protein